MDGVLRPFRPADAPACGALVEATPLWRRYGVGADRAATLLLEGHRAGDPIVVLEDGAGVAGFAWLVPRGAFGRGPYLRWIGVAPGRTGGGLGARLLAEAERIAGGLGPELFLLVSDFNEGARRFYARHGYREAGRLPELVLPGVTEVLLAKRLR